MGRAPRADAVQDAACGTGVAARSVLDSIEHGASIAQKGTTTRVIRIAPSGQLSGSSSSTLRGQNNQRRACHDVATIAPQPCIRCGMIERTSRSSHTMMQSCASRRGSSGRAHSLCRREAMDSSGSPPPRMSWRCITPKRMSAEQYLISSFVPVSLLIACELRPPAATWRPPALRRWSHNARARSAACAPKPRSLFCEPRAVHLRFGHGTTWSTRFPFGT